MPNSFADLPEPSVEALRHSAQVMAHLHACIARAGGFLSFERYMHETLYAPGLGYYSAGATKLGPDGDFVTASELSPAFGQALARQVGQIVALTSRHVLELGAGSGQLARDLLGARRAAGLPPVHYAILELSADLRERQQHTLAAADADLLRQVHWLERLPDTITGAVIANEVLDAIACEVVEKAEHGWLQCGVVADGAALRWATRPAPPALSAMLGARLADLEPLPTGLRLEINPAAEALVSAIASRLSAGAALFIDYGFPAAELYHPQRRQGTLMAHYRHRAHDDVLARPGLQDITAHVDFSAMAHAADDADASLYGYTSQAHFLINCGVLEQISSNPLLPADFAAIHAVQRLLSEAEMGELFKVLAFGRGLDVPLLGFARGDRLARL